MTRFNVFELAFIALGGLAAIGTVVYQIWFAPPRCYGDGKHDDTACIQRALQSGGKIYLPPGTYKLSDK